MGLLTTMRNSLLPWLHRSDAHETASFLVEKTSDIVLFLRTDGTVEAVNEAFFRQLGWPDDSLVNKSLTALPHEETSRDALQRLASLEFGDWEGDLDVRDPMHRLVPVHAIFRRVYNSGREAVGAILLLCDLRSPTPSAAPERETQLNELSNRRRVLHLLETEFQRFQRYGGQTSVLWLGVSGEGVDDGILHQTGEVLRAGLRKSDFCGRVGKREFLVVLTETPPEKAEVVAAKLQRLVTSVPYEKNGLEVNPEAAIKLAFLKDSDASTEVLLARLLASGA